MSGQQDKVGRVRPPRVHITYEVETNGARVKQELPFVVGVMGDFAGNGKRSEPLPPLRDRRFVTIDRDNIDDVMKRMQPSLDLRVPNTLADDGTEIAVQLKFASMRDFEPAEIVRQVGPLRHLQEVRDRLRDLLSMADRAQGLEDLLESILQDPSQVQRLASELGIDSNTKD